MGQSGSGWVLSVRGERGEEEAEGEGESRGAATANASAPASRDGHGGECLGPLARSAPSRGG